MPGQRSGSATGISDRNDRPARHTLYGGIPWRWTCRKESHTWQIGTCSISNIAPILHGAVLVQLDRGLTWCPYTRAYASPYSTTGQVGSRVHASVSIRSNASVPGLEGSCVVGRKTKSSPGYVWTGSSVSSLYDSVPCHTVMSDSAWKSSESQQGMSGNIGWKVGGKDAAIHASSVKAGTL